ncbi:hypothetical protein [Granulicella arctica]|uniref:Uncharacterized protein n=1 Tax=Granulicella arctica TaxID=940613 RepID=A0A7Y9THT8_9BACT|nr:hypothetical protein [Granulicella arctica]NYF80919.1 hypothetical protein [Granulicella arctica]
MKSYRIWKVLKMVPVVIIAVGVFGFVTMRLWNWLMPAIFDLKPITFVQALGLLLLGKILFGGFHRHSGGRNGWKRHMEERWAQMSPEERERFRAGMRGRRGCGFGPFNEPRSEQGSRSA